MRHDLALPVKLPSGRIWPSPQLTTTLLTALGFCAPAVTTKVKFAGSPLVGAVLGGVIRICGPLDTLTVTELLAVPPVLGVAGVVGVLGVDVPPLAPT